MPSASNLLVLNTAIPPLFALLVRNGGRYPAHFASPESGLSQEGMGMISAALEEGGVLPGAVDAFVFVTGPGSFTGIRVGLSMIKGMAFGRPARAVPVSSLLVLSSPFFGQGAKVCPVIDARMDQIYTALFSPEGRQLLPDQAVNPGEFAKNLSGEVFLAGEDGARFQAVLRTDAVSTFACKAPSSEQLVSAIVETGLAKFGRGEIVPVSDLSPQYLRKSYAEIKAGVC